MSRFSSYDFYPPYVPVAQRRRDAQRQAERLRKAGKTLSPVTVAGNRIAKSVWGRAWCDNLESYGDYASRLPRGRSYLRHGSVVDLQIEKGGVHALVNGTELYKVSVNIETLPKGRWTKLKQQCAGHIGSLVELLAGKISQSVMDIVSNGHEGLFPAPDEIHFTCSCPDWAIMCKHVAATLYGVGARLDEQPELLFALRGVDASELVETAVQQPASPRSQRKGRLLDNDHLSSIFGVDITPSDQKNAASPPEAAVRRSAKKKVTKKKVTKKKVTKKKVTKKKVTKKKVTKKKAAKKKVAEKKVTKKKATKKKATKKKATKKKATKKKATKKKATKKKAAKKKAARKKAYSRLSTP
ncbi:MAG: hypothetical protein OEZ06_20915 [Myxococcales bacterium]|nr:hypothetical protein [Myxococcales bacterium]